MPLIAAGADVWVEIDGVPLPVYEVQKERNRTICYIPSVAGKHFTVVARPQDPDSRPANRGRRMFLYIDGVRAGKSVTRFVHDINFTRFRISNTEVRKFQFAPLQYADEEEAEIMDEDRLRELGTIRLQIEVVELTGFDVEDDSVPRPKFRVNNILEPTAISEKSKKARTHCSTLGDRLYDPISKKGTHSCRRIAGPGQDFVFHYASLDWLQAKGIAPRKAETPVGSPSRPFWRKRRMSEESLREDLMEVDDADVTWLDPRKVDIESLKAKSIIRKKPRLVKEEIIHVPPEILLEGTVIDLTLDDD